MKELRKGGEGDTWTFAHVLTFCLSLFHDYDLSIYRWRRHKFDDSKDLSISDATDVRFWACILYVFYIFACR